MKSAEKIQNWKQAAQTIAEWQQHGAKVVFTNGCFDIVHLGHVDYLEKARYLGDKMVVGLNTDASVARLKGPSRPVVPEISRSRLMAAFEFVDLVVFFEEDTPLRLIQTLRPDILTKGSDYEVKNIVGADFVLLNGGKVETIDLVDGFSTSN
ncbi:MAG: D-glycero-beta-D-manno-heptose 1-phosphate adenylyltransferase, partial [Bacteroidota bacterium]